MCVDLNNIWFSIGFIGNYAKMVVVMNYREIQQQDMAGIFKVRTSTRENRLTMEELANRGVTPESTMQILQEYAKGWLCEDSEKVLGFTIGDGRTGEVLVLAVLPEAEGKGIGRQLLQLVQSWLFSLGHDELWLMENPDPAIRAYSFYRRLGWLPTGELRQDEHKLKLRKDN